MWRTWGRTTRTREGNNNDNNNNKYKNVAKRVDQENVLPVGLKRGGVLQGGVDNEEGMDDDE